MEYTILILLLPLLSFLVNGLLGIKLKPMTTGIIGTLSLTLVAALSYFTAYEYFTTQSLNGVWQTVIPYNTTWMNVGIKLHIDLGILIDPVSAVMLIVVSTLSLMVHINSLGKMK